MSGTAHDPSSSERLCGACGMCCTGVLFHSVELQPGENPRQLSALGLKLRRKKGVEFFLQPCSAHREENGACSCTIYAQRPARCRLFNCRQILAVEAGSVSEANALEKIRNARAQVARVNELIARLGESNPARSLAHRTANALTLAEGAERTELHDELDATMKGLEGFLAKEFRIA
jgi:Fe-S-cluster containining protein